MKINFKKEEESIINTLFLHLTYMSGDADSYEYEKVYIEGVDYTNYLENLDKIEAEVDKYKLIGRLTDCNDSLSIDHPRNGKIENKYEFIKTNYGEEIADLFDDSPGDSTVDGQWKAHLDDIEIHAYNELGEKLISYV